MSRAVLSRYVTVLFSLDCQAVTTGTVKPAVSASASLKRMRGRRAHARHTESGTLGVNIGRRRSWKVFTPNRVYANFSAMYRFTPFTLDHAPISEATPTHTPSRAKPLLRFSARIVWRARR